MKRSSGRRGTKGSRRASLSLVQGYRLPRARNRRVAVPEDEREIVWDPDEEEPWDEQLQDEETAYFEEDEE